MSTKARYMIYVDAFITAAKRLNCDPLTLAEALGEGGIAEMYEIMHVIVSNCLQGREPVSHETAKRADNLLARIDAAKGGKGIDAVATQQQFPSDGKEGK